MPIESTITIDKQRCKSCGLCIDACPNPNEILKMLETPNKKGHLSAQVINPEYCIGCGSCYRICPDGCIEILETK